MGDEIKKDPPEDVKVEKVAMRLAAKLSLKPYPSNEELKEIITPLISEVEDKLKDFTEEKNSGNISSMKKEISGIMDKMTAEHERGMEKMYQEHEEMIKEQHEGMKFIYDRVQKLRGNKIFTVEKIQNAPSNSKIGDIMIVEGTGDIYIFE